MPKLGVNIDHVATVRQARRTVEPDPVAAAVLCELAGCDSITVHLREDRRHIQDRDVRVLRSTLRVPLNRYVFADSNAAANRVPYLQVRYEHRNGTAAPYTFWKPDQTTVSGEQPDLQRGRAPRPGRRASPPRAGPSPGG